MFDKRISEDAEGDRRIIGSGRLADVPGRPGFFGRGRPADGAGTVRAFAPGLAPGGNWPVRERLRPRNVSATFRTWEKSWEERKLSVRCT
jgi:hypothetical protein